MQMQSAVNIKNSIATKLLISVFSIYFLITLTVTLIHMTAEYSNSKDHIITELRTFQKVFEPGIAKSIWVVSPEQLQFILVGMLEMPSIVGVKIEDESKKELGAIGIVAPQQEESVLINQNGDRSPPLVEKEDFSKLFSHQFPIIFETEGQEFKVGTGTIYSSIDVVFERVQLGFLFIIVNSIIKTIALWIIFLGISLPLLSRPLAILTKETEQLDLDNPHPSTIDVKTKGRNELKILEEAFNRMAQKLTGVHNDLKASLKTYYQTNKRLTALLEGTRTIISAPR